MKEEVTEVRREERVACVCVTDLRRDAHRNHTVANGGSRIEQRLRENKNWERKKKWRKGFGYINRITINNELRKFARTSDAFAPLSWACRVTNKK